MHQSQGRLGACPLCIDAEVLAVACPCYGKPGVLEEEEKLNIVHRTWYDNLVVCIITFAQQY